jgi:hypothetical protein
MTEATEALAALQGDELDPRSLDPPSAHRDGSLELFDQVRTRIVSPGGLFFLSKGILGFPDLDRRAHLALSLFYEDDAIQSKLVEFPKSHFKTSIGTIGKILHRFAKRVISGEDCWDRCAIASNTKTNAMRFLRLLKLVPESNILFQHFLPELLPEFSNEDVWNREEIIFPRRGAYTDPSVDTLGIGGAATTRHYTLLIEDDMLAEEDADSTTAIKKAIELHQYYTSLLVPGGDNTYSSLVNEHSWTEYDLNKHVIEKEPETAVFSVGATRGLNTKRTRLIPDYILRYTEPWNDGDTVFPAKYGHDELRRRRQKLGARLFNAVYENDPFDPDVVDFKEEWLNYYEWGVDKSGEKVIRIMPRTRHDREVEMEHVNPRSLNVVAAFDPALGKKTENARSALIIHGVDPIGRVFQLAALAIRDDPLKVLGVVFERVREWSARRCVIEDVLFQKVLIDIIEERCKFWNRDHPRDPIYPGTFEGIKPAKGKGKDARIRALIGASFEEGRIYVHANQTDFIDEYLHFPIGATVDLLDAFAYASTIWLPGDDEEDVEAFHEAEQRFLDLRDPVTGY